MSMFYKKKNLLFIISCFTNTPYYYQANVIIQIFVYMNFHMPAKILQLYMLLFLFHWRCHPFFKLQKGIQNILAILYLVLIDLEHCIL